MMLTLNLFVPSLGSQGAVLYKVSTTAFRANHGVRSGSQKSSRKKTPPYGYVVGCVIGIGYRARLYAVNRCRNKIAVRCLVTMAPPKTIIDLPAGSIVLTH